MRLSLFLVLAALVFAAVYAAPVKDEAEQQNGEPLTEEQQDTMNDEAEQQNGEPLTEEQQDPTNDEAEKQNGEPLTEEEQDPTNDEAEEQNGEPLTEEEQDPKNDEAFKRWFMRPKPRPKEPQRPVGPKLVPQKGETLEKDLFLAASKGKL